MPSETEAKSLRATAASFDRLVDLLLPYRAGEGGTDHLMSLVLRAEAARSWARGSELGGNELWARADQYSPPDAPLEVIVTDPREGG